MRRLILVLAVFAIAAASCSSSVPTDGVEPPAQVTNSEMQELLTTSTEPIVLNVWASWCTPCRSEAPLLGKAAREFSDEVRFIGLDVRDSQDGAVSFIAEFFDDAPIEHFADPGGSIPVELGGTRGVPLTFFFRSGGELSYLHIGIIDERTLALQVDELREG